MFKPTYPYSLRYINSSLEGGLDLGAEKALNHPLLFGRSLLKDQGILARDYLSQDNQEGPTKPFSNFIRAIAQLSHPKAALQHVKKDETNKADKGTLRAFTAEELQQAAKTLAATAQSISAIPKVDKTMPQTYLRKEDGQVIAITPINPVATGWQVRQTINRGMEKLRKSRELKELEDNLAQLNATGKKLTDTQANKVQKLKDTQNELQLRLAEIEADQVPEAFDPLQISLYYYSIGGSNPQNAGLLIRDSLRQPILADAPEKKTSVYRAHAQAHRAPTKLRIPFEVLKDLAPAYSKFQSGRLNKKAKDFYKAFATRVINSLAQETSKIQAEVSTAQETSTEQLQKSLAGLSPAQKGLLFKEHRSDDWVVFLSQACLLQLRSAHRRTAQGDKSYLFILEPKDLEALEHELVQAITKEFM